jgi:hypothetical protein
MEHEDEARRMERDADRMEHESDKVGEQIDDARSDWKAKEQDPSVPGAQPDDADEENSIPGVETDEELLSEEGGP